MFGFVASTTSCTVASDAAEQLVDAQMFAHAEAARAIRQYVVEPRYSCVRSSEQVRGLLDDADGRGRVARRRRCRTALSR
jgi:hypothetical protein